MFMSGKAAEEAQWHGSARFNSLQGSTSSNLIRSLKVPAQRGEAAGLFYPPPRRWHAWLDVSWSEKPNKSLDLLTFQGSAKCKRLLNKAKKRTKKNNNTPFEYLKLSTAASCNMQSQSSRSQAVSESDGTLMNSINTNTQRQGELQ